MIARYFAALSIALASVGAPMLAHAGIDVGAGSSMSFGDGALDLGCSHLTIEGSAAGASGGVSGVANVLVAVGGSFSPGAGQLTLGGNFANAGTFTPGTSAVDIVDACGGGTSTVSGSTSFYDFAVVTTIGKRLVLPALLTQSIAHALTLQGATSELLQVSSSAAGQQALLNVNSAAAQIIAYVDARDDRASGATIAPGAPATYQSVDDGNLTNWFGTDLIGPSGGNAPIPAPSLNLVAQLALLTGVLLLAWRRRSISIEGNAVARPGENAGTCRDVHRSKRRPARSE
jgi:hypothetical protein